MYVSIYIRMYIYIHAYIYISLHLYIYRNHCSVLQCVAVCCSVLQCVAVCEEDTDPQIKIIKENKKRHTLTQWRRMCTKKSLIQKIPQLPNCDLQCVAVRCSVKLNNTFKEKEHALKFCNDQDWIFCLELYVCILYKFNLLNDYMQRVAVCCSVLQYIAVC